MVSQQGKLAEAETAIQCFLYQQISPIELVIVHDSGNSFHDDLLSAVGQNAGENI